MIVAKFGGTSMADAIQIKKACAIMLADARRRVMVVSAPGKRSKSDAKITDLLIELAECALANDDTVAATAKITQRYAEIIDELGLPSTLTEEIERDIISRLQRKGLSRERFFDTLKAAGEDNCAKVVAAYLVSLGARARYVSPIDAGMILSERANGAYVLPASYQRLYNLRFDSGIVVFPGFFGSNADGEVVTFSRGGSDVTGSILAAALDAEIYENFTDVDHIFAADPKIIQNPAPIQEITYRQMRELAYAGFRVFHEEAVEPVVRARIPIHIKNTNNPVAPGTRIVFSRELTSVDALAIAGLGGFCNLTISKFLMNSEIGFGRRLFQIMEEEGLSFDHAPSGIDNISPILESSQLTAAKLERLVGRIKSELNIDSIEITHDLALIVIVGETVYSTKALVARAVKCLSSNGVEISMLNMSASSLSLTIGVHQSQLERSLKLLYQEFFAG